MRGAIDLTPERQAEARTSQAEKAGAVNPSVAPLGRRARLRALKAAKKRSRSALSQKHSTQAGAAGVCSSSDEVS